MRVLTVLVSAMFLRAVAGCAASNAESPKAPELTYSQADFNPPSEFDMSFAPDGVAQGPAIKRSQPAEGSYRARMVSMEKPGDETTVR
jgi:hypothetical protein